MDIENLMKHYWDCAGALEPATHTHKLLKSYYLTNCHKLTKSNIAVPKQKFSRTTMCRKCSSKWNESDFSMKLKPQEITYSSKVKKQIAKLYNAKQSIEQRRALTRKQRKRAKWLEKRVRNSMEMQCEFCKHKTVIPMHKQTRKERDASKNQTAELDEQNTAEQIASATVKLKKKKKQKSNDKTAGIKVEKVNKLVVKKIIPGANDTKITNTNEKHKTTKSKLKQKQDKTAAAITPSKPIEKRVSETKVLNKPKNTNAKLSQALKVKKKSKKNIAVTPKNQSKTQQQNSLLQLAALLKSQASNKSGDKIAQKRLESLLK